MIDQVKLGRGMVAALTLVTAACSEGGSGGEKTAYERGELVYRNVCIACHNPDPSLPGTVGPAIAGSSSDLLRHRVLHGTYPEGYKPQRSSALMPQFPHLEGSIDDLAAFLAEPRAGG